MVPSKLKEDIPAQVKLHGKSNSPGLNGYTPEHDYMYLCIEEGNGNPLQYSCLENPRDRGAWWAAVYEVAQSRTRLK